MVSKLEWCLEVGPHDCRELTTPKIIVVKSTVPVGTNAELARRMSEATSVPFDVASNPEFLKEGAAIDDFNKPDRVVVGVRRTEVAERLHALYVPFLRTDRPFLIMTPESAEMTKYVANCLLATKISFINEMANLCEVYAAADVNDVRRVSVMINGLVSTFCSRASATVAVASPRTFAFCDSHGSVSRASRTIVDGSCRHGKSGSEGYTLPQDPSAFWWRAQRQDHRDLGDGF